MFPKIFWVLVLLFGTIQFVTCDIVSCTPEMDTQCKKFCESTSFPMYCRLGRAFPYCRQRLEGEKKNTSCPKQRVKDLCVPFTQMLRCQDEILYCNCKKADPLRNEGCSIQLKKLINCPGFPF